MIYYFSNSGILYFEYCILMHIYSGVVVVEIVWSLDLQLPVQSVFITTSVVSSNPAQARCTRDVLDTTQYVMYLFVTDLRHVGGFLRVSFINKTDFHDVTEILLKVLNTITLILTLHIYSSFLLDNCHYFIETSRNKQSFNL